MRIAVALSIALIAGLAQAQKAYTCIGPNGAISLQDTLCKVVAVPPKPQQPPCPLANADLDRAIQREDIFLARFPDEPRHRRVELGELQSIAARFGTPSSRYAELVEKRRKLEVEMEFYKGKPLPPALKAQVDENEAQFAALADIFRGREQEVAAVVARYRCERETLGRRWAGGSAPGVSACPPECRNG